MAGLLIRMRLAMLRHQAGGWWGWKTWVGLGLALVVLANVPADSADAGNDRPTRPQDPGSRFAHGSHGHGSLGS